MIEVIRATLLGTIALRPRDEDLCDGFAKLHAGHVVHRIVNTGPDSRIARFLADGANEVRMYWEQVGEHLRFRRRERRVVGRITREGRYRKQRDDRRIELRRPDVPV